jgi:choice-of-anchor B domain-containing protein
MAGPYPCRNVDLVAHLPSSSFGGGVLNEVWGWTDPLDGTEYALVGKSNGLAFLRLTDPASPVYLGTLPPHSFNSNWRTLRTYGDYVFVGSEASSHGLQVFDLTRLRTATGAPAVSFTEDAWYGGFGRCHTLVIEEESGLLFACGTGTFSGGLHIVDISDPLNPVLAGGFGDDGYTHEAQVVVYDGPDPDYQGHVIVFCYNGNNPANLTIVDATDPMDAYAVSIAPYPQSAYCHQGWLTPDGRHLLMDDELDEYNGLFGMTRTLIWNVEDLDAPQFMGNFMGTTTAIDHNQIIIGNLSLQSNYTAGFRLIDITGIESGSLAEVGYFDHVPAHNNPAFQGEWMSYPFFGSGVIALTDIQQGLFLVRVNFIRLGEESVNVCADGSAEVQVFCEAGFAGPVQFSTGPLPMGCPSRFRSREQAARPRFPRPFQAWKMLRRILRWRSSQQVPTSPIRGHWRCILFRSKPGTRMRTETGGELTDQPPSPARCRMVTARFPAIVHRRIRSRIPGHRAREKMWTTTVTV